MHDADKKKKHTGINLQDRKHKPWKEGFLTSWAIINVGPLATKVDFSTGQVSVLCCYQIFNVSSKFVVQKIVVFLFLFYFFWVIT